jgi:hypothetical protein
MAFMNSRLGFIWILTIQGTFLSYMICINIVGVSC